MMSMDVGIMSIIIHEAHRGKDHNHCHLVGRSDGIPEGGSIMWIITHAPQHGRDPILRDYSTISTGRVSVPMSCSKATNDSSTHRYFVVVNVPHSEMNVNTCQADRNNMLITYCLPGGKHPVNGVRVGVCFWQQISSIVMDTLICR